MFLDLSVLVSARHLKTEECFYTYPALFQKVDDTLNLNNVLGSIMCPAEDPSGTTAKMFLYLLGFDGGNGNHRETVGSHSDLKMSEFRQDIKGNRPAAVVLLRSGRSARRYRSQGNAQLEQDARHGGGRGPSAAHR